MPAPDPQGLQRSLTITRWIAAALAVALCLVVLNWRRDVVKVRADLEAEYEWKIERLCWRISDLTLEADGLWLRLADERRARSRPT